jgi:putative GTP pyrophosphokinase
MITQKEFLTKYQIAPEEFDETGLKWENLIKIYEDYLVFRSGLEIPATTIFQSLMRASKVHSVRYRIKEPEHLIDKIIRKKIENPEFEVSVDSYKDNIRDLVGLRALHLFKEDWEEVNKYILEKLNVIGKPEANYRNGDSIELFKKLDCEVKEHKYGYRSVHYTIETRPEKHPVFVEVQVRTIFEEAWAEIDHTIRYPNDVGNKLFFQFLLILNRLTGSADEMGSFVLMLKEQLNTKAEEHKSQLAEKDNIVSDLEKKLKEAKLEKGALAALLEDTRKLREQKYTVGLNDPEFLSSIGKFTDALRFTGSEPWTRLAMPSEIVARAGDSLSAISRAYTGTRLVAGTGPTGPSTPDLVKKTNTGQSDKKTEPGNESNP